MPSHYESLNSLEREEGSPRVRRSRRPVGSAGLGWSRRGRGRGRGLGLGLGLGLGVGVGVGLDLGGGPPAQ
ncbi:hypothetical protein F2Q69_00012008 [Brassica cretica]|uniref:Uncharacterized protein n=1 Tax=Brassica cretica TaxID=69181 RepID=A0A8S9R0W3_BRACR|nr:hypothetical protein F2Q69_00012008 [Brassica cretica]